MFNEKMEKIKRKAASFIKENQILIVNDLIFVGVGFALGVTVNSGKWIPVDGEFSVICPYAKDSNDSKIFWSGADSMMNAINDTGWRLCKKR